MIENGNPAMDLIEKENRSIRVVLPRSSGREGLDKGRLGQLVDLIGSIGFTESDDHDSDDVLGWVPPRPVRRQGRRRVLHAAIGKPYVPTIASASPAGYLVASKPWDNRYYAIANTFINGGKVSGPTRATDFRVPNCPS